uniref:Uncharacterized protein n=1 Tax=Thermofilum pendens TaxID=2269 RepID=A0A7C4BBC8_THEPE
MKSSLFVKREETIRRATSLLTKALLVNLAVAFIPPIYILKFSGSIGLHTYVAIAFLGVSLASLLTVWFTKRALEDYDLASASSASLLGVVLGTIGGLVVVGLLVQRARKLITSI